jgi:citrate synthase
MAKKTLTICDNRTGKTLELPIYSGTMGPDAVDIGTLFQELDLFTLDPGFRSTAACQSEITYIDGPKGLLMYRGYPIDQLL